MIYNTEEDLHTTLDSLTDGEHIKAVWVVENQTITVEGAVNKKGRRVGCYRYIRWHDGDINNTLTSLEVARDEETTVTRENEKALHDLLDSLEYGETVTAEWRNEKGAMALTGAIRTDGDYVEVGGYYVLVIRQGTGVISENLHSVNVRHTVVQRWEREGDE